MADSSNDPNYLRLQARLRLLKGDTITAAANTKKAQRIDNTQLRRREAAEMAAAAAAASVAASARHSSTSHQQARNIQQIGYTFQQKIDDTHADLVNILADRDYKSTNAAKKKKARAVLADSISLLEKWNNTPQIRQIGAHSWYRGNTPVDVAPPTLAQQVQDLKDITSYVIEDIKRKHGGKRRRTRKRKTQKRGRKITKHRRKKRRKTKQKNKRRKKHTRKR